MAAAECIWGNGPAERPRPATAVTLCEQCARCGPHGPRPVDAMALFSRGRKHLHTLAHACVSGQRGKTKGKTIRATRIKEISVISTQMLQRDGTIGIDYTGIGLVRNAA